MTPRSVQQKILRLATGEKPRVLDLFSGCGGISLGFKSAGFEISAAIELDPDAARSHGSNFHPGNPKHALGRDITKITPSQLTEELSLGHPALAFDVIVGGPPCQAFARVGRSKLREVADHPEAFRHDPRARLYIKYLEYVEMCIPLAVVMENVPDILNHGGHNIAEEVCEVLESRGYICGYTLLNASRYGVPQMRERMFLVAYRKEIADKVSFPNPTNWIELPSGYEGTRAVALKNILGNPDVLKFNRYIPSPTATKDLEPAVTLKQAISDLPKIDARKLLANGLLKRGARRLDVPIPYSNGHRENDFVKQMRDWPGFKPKENLYDHVIRYLPRDYELFARLSPGAQYPEAFRSAEEMFEEKLSELKRKGEAPRKGSLAWKALRSSIVPPYNPDKFPNKWRKMEADMPSRTLLAHLGKDSYSHIHYDSNQARPISVREAARLQSFPDGFVFCGTMNPAFKQIGNAVPPLLAKAIASNILRQIRAGVIKFKDRDAMAGRNKWLPEKLLSYAR